MRKLYKRIFLSNSSSQYLKKCMHNLTSFILKIISTQYFFSKISPESPTFLWKLHRLLLKKSNAWHQLVLVNNCSYKVKYLAEGSINYVFQVYESEKLLKISRQEFYGHIELIDTRTQQSCIIMNRLAADGLAPKCEYLGGSSLFVDNAGAQINTQNFTVRELVSDYFIQLKAWSIDTGIVIVDFNEGNWCIKDNKLLLVDIDFAYTCQLQQISESHFVQRKTNVRKNQSVISILEEFLNVEEELLWSYFN